MLGAVLDAAMPDAAILLDARRGTECWTRYWMLDAVLDAGRGVTIEKELYSESHEVRARFLHEASA